MEPVQQELLDHECPEDALSADVQALGGPYTVGVKLRPELDKKAARNWLLNALNPDHNQNMTQSQIRLLVSLARERGSYHYIHFWEKDNNMSKSVPIEPEDEKVKLQKEFIRTGKDMMRMWDQFQKLYSD